MKRSMKRLLEEIEAEVRYTRRMTGRAELAPQTMRAIAHTPRELFVPKASRTQAYRNTPLSIGHRQTISQPFIVALMTDLLELRKEHVVLEIGTGSGYQAAILAQLCKQVYSLEYLPELEESARLRLQALGYDNIQTRVANGYNGWPEHAPYDGIMVTAGATHIPVPLLEQLRPGGRMVIPIGPAGRHQELTLVKKNQKAEVDIQEVLGVVFVPFHGEPFG